MIWYVVWLVLLFLDDTMNCCSPQVWRHLFWIDFPVDGSQTTSFAVTVCWNLLCSPMKLISWQNSLHHCLPPQDQPTRRARKKPAAAAALAALAVVPDSGLAAKDSDGPGAIGPVVEPEISVEDETPKQSFVEERESDSDVIMEIHEVDASGRRNKMRFPVYAHFLASMMGVSLSIHHHRPPRMAQRWPQRRRWRRLGRRIANPSVSIHDLD